MLEVTAQYCIAFVKNLEENYSPKNTDFQVMKIKYASLSALVDKLEPTFKYSDVNKNTKYPTVADAIVEYRNLEITIATITKNASEIFIPAVSQMKIEKAEAVSKDSPYLTVNFEELYQYYLTAKSVYTDGSVHDSLDPSTYPGLLEAVEQYETFEKYILDRVAESSAFVAAINGANSSSYYKTITSQLAEAAYYLDGNVEKSLEKYTGVEEAVALYEQLCAKLTDTVSNADAYIAAVAALNTDADYTALKTAVSNISSLKEKFNLIGYEGLEAANMKFAVAEAKVASVEGHSSTLKAAVAALKNAETLSERRTLIYVAINARDNAVESISGVTAAKAELEAYIKQYNDDVARVNALFSGVVKNSCVSISSAAPTDSVVGAGKVVAALLKQD